MFKNEDEFKKLIDGLSIDTKPNSSHRENLRQEMLSVFKKDSAQHPHSWPNIRRIIMKNRISKLAAAIIVIAVILTVTMFDKTVAPVYGITEALNVFKNAKTIHIHGWAYFPGKNKEELSKVAFEHWFDIETGSYRIVKPGGIDKDTGERKYFTTISDGEYIMSESYRKPVNGESYKAANYKKITQFQSRFQAHNNSYNFLMQMFGGVDLVKGFVLLGNEEVNGLQYDIWQGEISTPGPTGGMQVKIKTWLDPQTGELARIQTWRKLPNSDQWISMFEVDQIEINVELSAELFITEPPENCKLNNTKETAPLAELGATTSASVDDYSLNIHVGFTLSDGSVILCWRSTDKSQPLQGKFFENLELGGNLPKLPLELYALKPIADLDVQYQGYHLAHTKKNDKFYEWAIYVPQDKVPLRKNIIGYQVLHRFNISKDEKVGSIALSLHEDIQIDTQEDFDLWVLGAIKELSDNATAPENITFDSILQLAEQLGASAD